MSHNISFLNKGLLLIVALLVLSCAKSEQPSESTGVLSLSVEQLVVSSEVEELVGRSGGLGAAVANGGSLEGMEYRIVAYDGSGIEVYNDIYVAGQKIVLPTGRCTVWAMHGDNTPGFDKPYYAGSSEVVIKAGVAVECSITTSLTNAIIVAPSYSEELVAQFSSYCTRVSSAGQVFELQAQDERALYVRAGEACVIEIVGVNRVGEEVVRVVTDENFWPEAGKRYKESFWLTLPVFNMAAQHDGTVWSHSFIISELSASDFANANHLAAYGERLRYECSLDGATWSEVPRDQDGLLRVAELSAGTAYRYYLRARIDISQDRTVYSTNNVIFDFTTETPTQLVNAGMEDWQYSTIKKGLGTKCPIYYPWGSGQPEWWNSSNPRGFTYSVTTNQTNSLPGVLYSYVNARSGRRAAEVRSTYPELGGRGKVAGKLLIGKLTSGGFSGALSGNCNPEYITEGRPFAVRPTQLRFWCKYTPYGVDGCVFTVRVRSGDVVIAETVQTHNASIAQYQQIVIDIPYSRSDLKATSLYVCFASSPSDNCPIQWVPVSYPDNPESGWKGNVGSILWIDDIELGYQK